MLTVLTVLAVLTVLTLLSVLTVSPELNRLIEFTAIIVLIEDLKKYRSLTHFKTT